MSSYTDGLQWKIKDLQEEVKVLKKQKEWLLTYIEENADYDKEVMKNVKEHLKIFKKWKTQE